MLYVSTSPKQDLTYVLYIYKHNEMNANYITLLYNNIYIFKKEFVKKYSCVN